jgi:NAD(P)-dependent dehydrogenase (short-subunit alcohol dehydrogenase family)
MAGRVALVTGGGRGIGRVTAELLAARGDRVMVAARTEAELAAVARPGKIEYTVGDVADPGDCARIVSETTRRLGAIEILVNNAGMGSAEETEIWDADTRVWSRSLATNLTAPFELTRLTVPEMLARGYGRIVMVCSAAAIEGGVAPGMPAYAAAKHGLLGLTRAVALDVASRGVTCNAVLPGSVRTRTAEAKVETEAARAGVSVEEAWAARVARFRAGRLVTAEEVAHAIGFLASEEASGINGAAVPVLLGG